MPRDPREERRAVRRQEFVDAAVEVIRRDGPNVSMDRVAAEMGVTKPILYRHVGDRGELAAAIAKRFATDLSNELSTALARDTSPRDQLVAAIDAYLAFVERDPNVYRFLVQRVVAEQPQAHAQLVGFINHVAADVAVVLGERLREAGLDSGAAEPWAFGLVGMVHAAGDWWLDRRTMPRARLVEYLTSLTWSGMARLGLDVEEHPVS